MQPERDVEIVRGVQALGLDPSQAPLDIPQEHPSRHVSSKLVIDATKKHAFPHVSVPPREHLEVVDARWDKYGLQRYS